MPVQRSERQSRSASLADVSATDEYGEPAPERGGAYTYTGPISWEYSPKLDRDADPGEIVWAWVAFEENAHVGKDRPVAVVGRADDGRLVGLMLSSRGHDGDRDWISIGTGPWDKEGRESWVRRDRVLAVHTRAVRREGAVMPRSTYEAIVAGMGGHARRARPGILARLRGMLSGK